MDMNNYWFNAIYSLVPTLLVGLIFWFIVRAIIKSDSRERAAYAKYAKQEREAIKRASELEGDSPVPQVGGDDRQPSKTDHADPQ
ncbi:hypothetical protein ACFSBZ_17005 [Amnibacterium flavum]|uniref:Uncharacterized protein n=1 Tax=Amnibacterium flavum TaxID=2173173 RepID=A0A2V1HKQ1_9MICO|nr:hypothetical protein [Amnibacterium flavum]PVZ93193.1 hypothetical protein DDQ50_16860 [Amnibacterium flavum]